MTEARYKQILDELSRKPQKEKCKYLLSVIEETDYDTNGYNNELRKLYNKYNKKST